LVPFVEEFVPVVDIAQGLIVITPPEGLLELNESAVDESQTHED
jgi:16S rRNA processing protein RimM